MPPRFTGWFGYRGWWSAAVHGPSEWDVRRNLCLTPHWPQWTVVILPYGVKP